MEMIRKLEDNTFIEPKGYNHLMVNLSSYNEKIYKGAVTGALNCLYYEEKIKMETRRYAKRQITWFKKIDNIIWLDSAKGIKENVDTIIEKSEI